MKYITLIPIIFITCCLVFITHGWDHSSAGDVISSTDNVKNSSDYGNSHAKQPQVVDKYGHPMLPWLTVNHDKPSGRTILRLGYFEPGDLGSIEVRDSLLLTSLFPSDTSYWKAQRLVSMASGATLYGTQDPAVLDLLRSNVVLIECPASWVRKTEFTWNGSLLIADTGLDTISVYSPINKKGALLRMLNRLLPTPAKLGKNTSPSDTTDFMNFLSSLPDVKRTHIWEINQLARQSRDHNFRRASFDAALADIRGNREHWLITGESRHYAIAASVDSLRIEEALKSALRPFQDFDFLRVPPMDILTAFEVNLAYRSEPESYPDISENVARTSGSKSSYRPITVTLVASSSAIIVYICYEDLEDRGW